MSNNTCINFNQLRPIYNEILACTIGVILLVILILCKLLENKLGGVFKMVRVTTTKRNGTNINVTRV